MKKLIAFMLGVLMLVSLLSCGDKLPSDEPITPTVPETPVVTAPPAEPEREKVSIAFESRAANNIVFGEDFLQRDLFAEIWRSAEDVWKYYDEYAKYDESPQTKYILEMLAPYTEDAFFEENIVVAIWIGNLNSLTEKIQAVDVYKYADGEVGEVIIELELVHNNDKYTDDAMHTRDTFIVLDKNVAIDEDKITIKWVDGKTLWPEEETQK